MQKERQFQNLYICGNRKTLYHVHVFIYIMLSYAPL